MPARRRLAARPVPGVAARAAAALRRFVATIEALRAERDRPLAELLDLILLESGYSEYPARQRGRR